MKQIFDTLNVLYDDKKWGKRIDPDEWNSNFKVLEEGHNELVEKLNIQVDTIESAIASITEDGGNNIDVKYEGTFVSMQYVLDKIASDINNRYTKNESDAIVGENTNELIEDITYSSANGVFTITKKNGEIITIDTVIEKIPASMMLKEESDGSVYLVVTNQDGSTTKTNVTSLIEDTVINGSNTIVVNSVNDSINKKTTYTLEIKPNSITLNHLSSEVVSKIDRAIESASIATEAKNTAVNNATTSTTKANEASQSATIARTSATNAEESAEHAESSKVAAQLAQAAAEKARDEAQTAAGGDFATNEALANGIAEAKAYADQLMTVDESVEV